MTFQTKSFNTSVTSVNDEQRIVEGYFSTFGHTDSDNDIIMPGAFTKTILENGPNGKNRIKFLSQHNPYQPLGPVIELSEDNVGLKYKAKISKTSYGNDIYELIKDGSLTEHSIGFKTVRSEKDMKTGINHIKEIALFEGSVVSWGANEHTPFTGVKSVGEIYDELEYINTKLRKGDIEDISFLEIKLKQLQQALVELSPTEEPLPVEETTIEEPDTSKEELELVELFKENLSFLKNNKK